MENNEFNIKFIDVYRKCLLQAIEDRLIIALQIG